jgi:hypothetical protein
MVMQIFRNLFQSVATMFCKQGMPETEEPMFGYRYLSYVSYNPRVTRPGYLSYAK